MIDLQFTFEFDEEDAAVWGDVELQRPLEILRE